MQNSRASLGDEDCAEGNNVDLRRATEVSVGTHQMLRSEMGNLESLHKELETSQEYVKKLLQGMDELRELSKREYDLLTRELHTSTEARKQVSEMINKLREERESVMKELELYKEARTQLSREMIELRAFVEREKEERVRRELKAYREAGKQPEMIERAASPSNESDEKNASSPTLFGRFTGLFVSSKSTRLRKHSQQRTQQKEFEVTTEASTERKEESLKKEKDNSGEAEKQLLEELNDSKDQFEGLMKEYESVKETKNLGAASPSNECVEPDTSGPTLLKKFKGFFVSSKSRRQRRHSNEKKQEELKVIINTEASLGTRLLADPSHEYYHGCRKGHDEPITDIRDNLENDEVETGATAFVSNAPPRPRKKTKSRSTNDETNCSQDRESENERGMVSTSRAIDNYARRNHFEVETSMQFNQTADRRQRFDNDRALQHFSGYYNACSYFIGPQIYSDQLQCTGPGQLLPMRPAKSLPSLLCERDIIPPRDSEIKIELQPKSQKRQQGTKVIFELKVQQPDKYSYQWLKDGAELQGNCDATLILDHVELCEFGWYTCRVNCQENFGINCESSRAWLDVVPKVQNGTRLKTFKEVDVTTCDRIAFFFDKQVPFGVGGTRQAAAVFGMNEDMIGALGTCRIPGQEVIEFLKATKPDMTVYTLCKQLKGDKMRRFDIAKVLENHLTITESEV